jgi:hypothetical protein
LLELRQFGDFGPTIHQSVPTKHSNPGRNGDPFVNERCSNSPDSRSGRKLRSVTAISRSTPTGSFRVRAPDEARRRRYPD